MKGCLLYTSHVLQWGVQRAATTQVDANPKNLSQFGLQVYDLRMVFITGNHFGCAVCGAVSYTHLDVYKRQDYEVVYKR